jgi:hypothetical protein
LEGVTTAGKQWRPLCPDALARIQARSSLASTALSIAAVR